MADVFRLSGEYSALAATREVGVPVAPEVIAEVLESMYLQDKLTGAYLLSADAPVSVGFGSLAAAHVIVIRSTNKVRCRLTSSDGSAQALPVDPILILLASAVPVTAIDLTRLAGVNTEVSVFLGERT